MLRDSTPKNSNNTATDPKDPGNSLDNPNSAKSTALSCRSEKDLRIPCYCEENVWRLAYRRLFSANSSISAVDKENEQYYVVFISNDERCCPMLNQRASNSSTEPCFWDYHVILVQSTTQQGRSGARSRGKTSKNSIVAQVLDMDSRLKYPCTLDEYLNGTFQLDFIDGKAKKTYSPKFRLVRAELFLQNFYSDRMHMYQDGKWSANPPRYDCIVTDVRNMKMKNKGAMSNLNDYISMAGGKGKESSVMGEVLTIKELRSKFGA